MSSGNSNCNSTPREGHADTIGKQLADIKGKGVATLKRVTEASEGRIVMRQTDSGSRLSSGFGGAFVGGVGSGLAVANLYVSKQKAGSDPSVPAGSTSSLIDSSELNAQLLLGADDSISVTTTTSDVNSEDDAASIVSRLSQIVVEQEEKLLSSDPQNQMLIIDNSSDPGRQRPNASPALTCAIDNNGPDPGRSGAQRRPGSADLDPMPSSLSSRNNQLRPSVNRVRSLRSNSLVDQQLRDRKFGPKPSGKARHCSQDYGQPSNGKLLFDTERCCSNAASDCEPESARPAAGKLPKGALSGSGRTVPEIHVIIDEDQWHAGRDSRQARGIGGGHRSRAQSIAGVKIAKEDRERPLNRRRESSSGFSPERGDLKSLELSRANPQRKAETDVDNLAIRNRSNTSGSMDKAGLVESKDQLILNIRRSAWTLSDFDQTFNKSGHKSTGSNDTLIESCATKTPDASDPVAVASSNGTKQASGDNLLIKVFQGKQTSVVADSMGANGRLSTLDCPQNTAASGRLSVDYGQPNSDRRPSATHSIISIPTSVESFRSNIYGFSQPKLAFRKNKKKLKKAKGQQEDIANFSDGSQPPGDGDKSPGKSACGRSCFNIATFGRYVPIVQWLPAYKLNYFWGDLMAGLAVAVLNISTSLSAAVVAETDFSVAFRASIINTFVYALLCSSRHTSFGSWSIMSQMLLVSVRKALSDELILARINLGPSANWESDDYERWHLHIIVMYTFLIGLVQLACGLLNLGKILASFIPEALCSSMITATAFTMAIGQLSNMCGTSNKILWSIEKNTTELWADLKNPPVDITDLFAGLFRWIKQIALLVKYYEQINLTAVAISIISVTLLILNQYVIQKQLERFFKRKIFIPSELILLVLMIMVSNLLNLKENYSVTTCGPLNIDFVVPDWPNFRLIRELWFDSFATALISFTMVYVMAKTYSNKFNYEVDCNQELIACGAGNLIGGLCDALPATASFSRTAGQVEAGGQTQLASIVNCVGLFIMARILGHHVAELPVCVMAATLFYGFARMMTRFPEVFMYWRVCKVDFAIWVVTFISILTLDIVNGFIYGFIFSILTMLYRAQK